MDNQAPRILTAWQAIHDPLDFATDAALIQVEEKIRGWKAPCTPGIGFLCEAWAGLGTAQWRE